MKEHRCKTGLVTGSSRSHPGDQQLLRIVIMRDGKSPTDPNQSSYAAWVQCAAMCPSAWGTAMLTFAPLAGTTWQANRRAEAAQSSLAPLLIYILSFSLSASFHFALAIVLQLLFVIFHFNFTSVDFFICPSPFSSTLASWNLILSEPSSPAQIWPLPAWLKFTHKICYSWPVPYSGSCSSLSVCFPCKKKKKPQTLWRQKPSRFCFFYFHAYQHLPQQSEKLQILPPLQDHPVYPIYLVMRCWNREAGGAQGCGWGLWQPELVRSNQSTAERGSGWA